MNTEKTFDIIIVGAGLAGLSTAYGLKQFHTLILEQNSCAGGRVSTKGFKGVAYDVGAVLGYDPDYLPFEFLPPKAVEETGQLGLFFEEKLYFGETVEGCLQGVFQDTPEELSIIRAVQAGRTGLESLTARARDALNAFFQVVHPGEIEEYLPAFQFHAFLRYRPLHYINGNAGLIREYLDRIHADIEYDAKVLSIKETENSKRFCLSYSKNGEKFEAYARCVVVATPAPIAQALLPDMNDQCRRFLKSVRYGRFTVVALGLKTFSCVHDFSYIVTPALPVTTIYKMTFPGSPITVLLFYYCNRVSKEIESVSDEHLIDLTRDCANRIGIAITQSDVLFADISRWTHGGTIISSESYASFGQDNFYPASGIYLAGDYLYRNFPYGMEAAIRSGTETAEHVGYFLQSTECEIDRRITHQNFAIRDNQIVQHSNELVLRALKRCMKELVMLGREVCQRPMPMTCIPLCPDEPFPFGDLVPVGFLLRALQYASEHPDTSGIQKHLREFMSGKKQENLWGFHTGHLITSTDSSLILLGIDDIKAVETLETFYDGQNGYYPQLWSHEPRPYHMQANSSYRHWCQTDFGTTCFIRGLRKQHGLTSKTPIAYLYDRFSQRSGLYFANPYLVDWALAMAIKDEPQALVLRTQLLCEVLASQKPDYSFGEFDRLLSTALAVLTLTTLGYVGNSVQLARKWIAEVFENDAMPEKAIPFYSSEILDEKQYSFQKIFQLKTLNGQKVSKIGKDYHAVSYYEDSYRILAYSIIFLALRKAGQECRYDIEDADIQICHPRYQCKDQAEYIFRFALPPYAGNL